MTLPRAVLAAVLLGTAALAQSTWVVDAQNRPGAQFLDLPPAVAHAAPGDLIVLRGGNAVAYSAAVIGRSLRLRTEQGEALVDRITVRSLPAGETVTLWNVSLRGWQTPLLAFEQCAGNVHLEAGSTLGPLAVTDCAHVAVVDCNLNGWGSPHQILRSEVSVTGTTLESTFFQRGPCVQVQQATVRALRSTFFGGEGQVNCLPSCTRLRQPTPAILATQASLVLGAGCAVVGNTDTVLSLVNQQARSSTLCVGPSIQGTGSVVLGTGAVIACGGGPGVAPAALADVTCAPLLCGAGAAVRLNAVPGSGGILFVGWPRPGYLSTPHGDLLADPAALAVLGAGVTDGQGLLPAVLAVPASAPRGMALVLQGVVLDAQGTARLALPALRAVRD